MKKATRGSPSSRDMLGQLGACIGGVTGELANGLEELIEHERLADSAVGADTEGHVQVTDFSAHPAPGYGDYFYSGVVASKVHDGIDTAFFRHNDVRYDDVDVIFAVNLETLKTIPSFTYGVAGSLEDGTAGSSF